MAIWLWPYTADAPQDSGSSPESGLRAVAATLTSPMYHRSGLSSIMLSIRYGSTSGGYQTTSSFLFVSRGEVGFRYLIGTTPIVRSWRRALVSRDSHAEECSGVLFITLVKMKLWPWANSARNSALRRKSGSFGESGIGTRKKLGRSALPHALQCTRSLRPSSPSE